MKPLKHLCYLFALVILTACNGEPINGTNEGGGSTTPPPSTTVTLELDRTDISASTPATATATVKIDGKAEAGVVVTFSSDIVLFDVESATALTDADGKATIGVLAGDIQGAGTVTAEIDSGESDSVGVESAGDGNQPNPSPGTPTMTVSVVMVEPKTTNEISVINATTPGQLIATVTGTSEPVIVTFSSDIGEIPIPTAITDANNQAIVDIYAGNNLGAGTVTATLKGGESGEKLIVVGATDLQMGSGEPFVEGVAQLSLDTLSAGGTAVVTVDIKDDVGNSYNLPVSVEFSSNCVSAGTATLSTPISTSNGRASSTYLAQGCVGDDPITVSANAGGVNLAATATLHVLPADAGSVEFVSASPENISLRGVGGTESSTVKFRVLDVNGNPVANTLVDFSLNTDVGGVALDPMQATSDSNGMVQTVVNAGSIATSVRVTASINGLVPAISSQSSLLVISTGIPDQDSISLSAETLNPEGWDIDGTQVAITARLADAFNNPAPDGTAISFTTEGGSIEPSCTTVNGVCSVMWTSQQPRPDGATIGEQVELTLGSGQFITLLPSTINPIDLATGRKVGGRATIVATAIGEESFIDLNGNGRFDGNTQLAGYDQTELDAFLNQNDVSGRPFDLPEAFVDHNEDGVFDRAVDGGENETFIDFNTSAVYDNADGAYNGSLCAEGLGVVEGCSEKTSLNVRAELVLVMSGSNAYLMQNGDGDENADPVNGVNNDGIINIQGKNSAWASVVISDLHNQPMPKGTIVEFTATAGSIVGPDSFIWPNDNHNGGLSFSVTIEGEDEPKNGTLIVEVTTPGGQTSVFSAFSIVISAAPATL
ncbi:hypothetical protein QWY77_02080 [Thalassotalea ponticola]|uniref:hypothetical protein n=1 Tax=Thalassotalea ponticola TaxID=1523392 RepID=UPI0025B61A0C|nr:hypothetical protein [Thalassotalea ponticola]MDN3651559.1 hypothetical protein [Thalassotalea ponticola]